MMCARPCTPRLCGVGRGGRPRSPGPRGRIVLRRRPCAGGGRPGTSAPTMYTGLRATWCARPCTSRLCGVGRGRRPRRPAWTYRPPASSLCVRGAGGRGRPPLPCVYGPARHMMCARFCTPRLCGVGRGRRPRRPAWTYRPPASSLCAGRAAGDVRPYHVYGPARHMICAALRVRPYHVRASARVMGVRAWGRRSRKWRRVVSIWPLRTSLPISVERADRSTLR